MSCKKNKGKKRKLLPNNNGLRKRNTLSNRFPLDIGTEFAKALQYHQSGQLRRAGELYERILDINPTHSDSLHLLGIIAHQTGKSDTAVNLINQAIQNTPESPFYYNNLGNVFQDQGKLDKAISCYQEALSLKPDYAEAYKNMGNAFRAQAK